MCVCRRGNRLIIFSTPPHRCVLNTFKGLNDRDWTYTNVMGACALVIDRTLDTFLFRIYDLESMELRFEYELYEDIDYKSIDEKFHVFEMDDCMAVSVSFFVGFSGVVANFNQGFAFANKDEAPKFLNKVTALKPSAKNREAVDALKGKGKEKKKGGLFGGSKKEAQKPMQIGGVTNVIHNQHIGINADGTFDLNNISPEWKAMFRYVLAFSKKKHTHTQQLTKKTNKSRNIRQAGIKKKDLENPEVAKAIITTIAEQTGMAVEVKKETLIQQDDLKKYYTEEQQREYEKYLADLAKYEADLAAYEAEQGLLKFASFLFFSLANPPRLQPRLPRGKGTIRNT